MQKGNPMGRIHNERGVILATTIFALVVIGALIAGAFFLGVSDQRVGRNGVKLTQAFAAAEAGAQTTLAEWNKDTYNAVAWSDSVMFDGWLADSTGWYRGSVRRIADMIYLIRSEGFSRDSSARQQVGGLVRLKTFELNVRGSFSTVGGLRIGGSARIDGTDTEPDDWPTCPDTEPQTAGVVTDDTTEVYAVGALPGNRLDTLSADSVHTKVFGDPELLEDPAIDTSTIFDFDELNFDSLAARRDFTLGPGTYGPRPSYVSPGGACDSADNLNWGEPWDHTDPCGTRSPIIYASGILRLTNGRGQGILIVDGDVTLAGNFEFYGPIIVRGDLGATGSDNTVHGAVIASGDGARGNLVMGDAEINYSSCALIKALAASAVGAPMRERGWLHLY